MGVGKTYRKLPTGKPHKKTRSRGKHFRIKQKNQLEFKEYENETEVSELYDDGKSTDS